MHDFTFEEGPLSDEVITNAFEKVHDLYDDYLHLKTKAEPLNTILFKGDFAYPKPEGVGDIKDHDHPMKVPLAQRNSSNNAHGMIKQKVEYVKTQFGLHNTHMRTIPQKVNALPDNSTIVTGGTSSADTKLVKKKR